MGFGLYEDVIVGPLSVIDLRAGDHNIGIGDRRDIFDEKFRQALRGDLIHRSENNSVAVSVNEMFVDPAAAGQIFVGKLSC